MDRGLGVFILAHPAEYLWWVQLFVYMVGVLGAPIKGAIANHRGGDAYDKDARFGS
jgi:hypothetical protein